MTALRFISNEHKHTLYNTGLRVTLLSSLNDVTVTMLPMSTFQ